MNKAVVRVPVADVAAASLKRYTSGNVRRVYERFTWAPDKGACSCMRVHQVKYNEVVTLKPSPRTMKRLNVRFLTFSILMAIMKVGPIFGF